MSTCPHCNENIGSSPTGYHFCGEVNYKIIKENQYQCTKCGYIQSDTGKCCNCGILLDCRHCHCPCCGCCTDTCHCSCCCY